MPRNAVQKHVLYPISETKLFLLPTALKSHESTKYYINGNRRVDLPEGYKVAGTTVYYTRPRRNNEKVEESFLAEGPTTEDLDVMVGRRALL